jgi:hypothetical protein
MPTRRKRCEFCLDLFRPHPRLGDRQRACFKEGCKERRKAAARGAWRARHPDCFKGREAKHKAYREARRRGLSADEGGRSSAAEQDAILAEPSMASRVIDVLLGAWGEQDAISAQLRLLLGLTASLAESGTEQDAIALRVAMLDNLGRRVLERVARPARPLQQASVIARGGGPP